MLRPGQTLKQAFLSVVLALILAQPSETRLYEDPAARFSFMFPSSFGSPSAGTNNGFGNRVAAIRFSAFPDRFGGEAVVTRGFPLVDLQAVGGLYDSLTLEIFPEPLRSLVMAQLSPLTTANFCAALGQTRHVDLERPAFSSLTAAQRQAIGQTDLLRNASPRVVECQVVNDLVVFDKERALASGYPLHVYGAVRFLPEPFSTFQLIAGGEAPTVERLSVVRQVVTSFRLR